MVTGCEAREPKITEALVKDSVLLGKNNVAEVLIMIECDTGQRQWLPGAS